MRTELTSSAQHQGAECIRASENPTVTSGSLVTTADAGRGTPGFLSEPQSDLDRFVLPILKGEYELLGRSLPRPFAFSRDARPPIKLASPLALGASHPFGGCRLVHLSRGRCVAPQGHPAGRKGWSHHHGF